MAAILLLLTAPVFLLIACGIKLTSLGPVFYRQKRRGYRGSPFFILKFRTMEMQPSPSRDSDLRLTMKNDPRVFAFGALLRRSSLDELPQLLNVLRGDMWVIGPRPHALFAKAAGVEYCRAVSDYNARYIVKPGITGWAQVNGWRGPTETVEQLAKRVQHDLYYIENWSLSFDVVILLRTLFCIVPHENAY